MSEDLPIAKLSAASLPQASVAEWATVDLAVTNEFGADAPRFADFWARSRRLLEALPKKPKRNEAEQAAAQTLLDAGRQSRERFLGAHVEGIYEHVTGGRSRFLRLEELLEAAASAVPGLAPTRQQIAVEAGLEQRDKDGVEVDQGIFLAHVFAMARGGGHLCHAMLLPRAESPEFVAKFAKDGVLDLGPAHLLREGRAVRLTATNARFLNAEDDTTLDQMEIAVDVAILDSASDIVLLRGGKVEHPKYHDRHVFGAGINLTHLYLGRIPFLWFLNRDLGYLHKIFRGVAQPDSFPDDVAGRGVEKPWVAAVDTFAIGGHCQALLCMDYVLAAADAFMTLPARKEGIIPGFANLRLPRFTGDRIARQAIQFERRLNCDSPEGRLLCDEIAPAHEMDAAIGRTLAGLTSSGSVSAVGNRRAFRVGQEPLDLFRRYASVYAREQAYCHFSPALIANLERNWDARNRRV
jgi:thioesterase DpgC